MGTGAAQAAHVPSVHDLVLPHRQHGIAVHLVHRLATLVEAHGRAEHVGVVDAAHELPLAVNAPTAIDALGAAHGGGGTGDDRHWVCDEFWACGEAGRQQAERLDADHQVPAGAAVDARRGFNHAHLRGRRRLRAVIDPRRRHPVQPRLGKGLRHGRRQAVVALRLVGMGGDQRCQRFGLGDERISLQHHSSHRRMLSPALWGVRACGGRCRDEAPDPPCRLPRHRSTIEARLR